MPTISTDEMKIHYIREGQGVPLVFIMGIGGKAKYWTPDLKFWSSHYDCICPDNRGVDGTSLPENKVTISQMAEDVNEILKSLDMENANILGLSMGGAIAQELAINYPERVGKLILSSTWSVSGAYEKWVFDSFTDMFNTDYNLYLKMALFMGFAKDYFEKNSDLVEAIRKNRLSDPFPADAINAHYKACSVHDTSRRLEKIKAATLITVGDGDLLIHPDHSHKLADKIPNARLIEFKDCGHLHLWEQPELYQKTVVEFLNNS